MSAACRSRCGQRDLAFALDPKASLATPAHVGLVDHLPAALSVPLVVALDERRVAIDCGLCGGARHDDGRTERLPALFPGIKGGWIFELNALKLTFGVDDEARRFQLALSARGVRVPCSEVNKGPGRR